MHRAASEGERGEGLHWVASVADGNNTHRGESFEKTEAEALVNDGGGCWHKATRGENPVDTMLPLILLEE